MLIELIIILVLAGIGAGTAMSVINDKQKERIAREELVSWQRKHNVDSENIDELYAAFAAKVDILEEQAFKGETGAKEKLELARENLKKAQELKQILKQRTT